MVGVKKVEPEPPEMIKRTRALVEVQNENVRSFSNKGEQRSISKLCRQGSSWVVVPSERTRGASRMTWVAR